MSKTGIGTAITFSGDTSYSGRWLSVGAIREFIETLDDTALDSDGFKEKVASDLADIDPIEVEVYWDYSKDAPTLGGNGTLTITFPKQAKTNAGKITGSAFITDFTAPELTTDDTQLIGSITFQFDGKTGPTYTKAT